MSVLLNTDKCKVVIVNSKLYCMVEDCIFRKTSCPPDISEADRREKLCPACQKTANVKVYMISREGKWTCPICHYQLDQEVQ